MDVPSEDGPGAVTLAEIQGSEPMAEVALSLPWTPRALLNPTGKSLENLHFLDRRLAGEIEDDWRDLVSRAVEDNPFLDPDILLPAMRHLDPGERVRLAVLRGGDGRLAALLPLTAAPLGRLAPAHTFWAHPFAPLGVPLIAAEDATVTWQRLIEGLAGDRALVIPYLPTEGPAALALAGNGRARIVGASQRAALNAASVELRADLPARRRKEFGRQMRRLSELGAVSVETQSEAAAVRAAFEDFLTLEASGWKGRRATALAADPHRLAFARDIVFRRSGSGGCRIVSLCLDGRPVAMVVSFVARETAATWKIAYDERFARFSPGAQLMLEAAPALLAEPGVRRIDSLAEADHPMIDGLWPDRIALGTVAIAPSQGGALHRLGLAAAEAEARLRRMVHERRSAGHRRRREEAEAEA